MWSSELLRARFLNELLQTVQTEAFSRRCTAGPTYEWQIIDTLCKHVFDKTAWVYMPQKERKVALQKIPCLKSHIQIQLPAGWSWCTGQMQLSFVRCPFGLSNLNRKAWAAGMRSARKFRRRKLQKLVRVWTNWHFLPQSFLQQCCVTWLSLPEPSTGSCGCSDRRSAQIAHSKRFLSRCMCRSLAGCPKSCRREELVESHWEPIELKVPRVVVENTELPCPQHSSVLLGDMPRERVVQNDGHNQCNNHRRWKEHIQNIVELGT